MVVDASKLGRYAALWLVICGGSAVPSFWMAMTIQASLPAMIAGVLVFVVGYTVLSCSSLYAHLKQKKHLFRAFRAGFAFRLILSVLSLLALLADDADMMEFILLHDGVSGQIAVETAKRLFNLSAGDPLDGRHAVTFVATLLQGLLLNAIVLLTILVFYSILKMCVWMVARLCPKGETV